MCRYRMVGIVMVGFMLLITACNEQKSDSPKATATQDSQLMRGQEIYLQVCAACHATGLAGAPRFGNKDDWSPRIAKGIDQLVLSVTQGKGNMPARGGQAGLGDKEILAAVTYMVKNSQ